MTPKKVLIETRFRLRFCTDDLIRKYLVKLIRFLFSGKMAPNKIITEVGDLDSKAILRISKKQIIVSMPEPVFMGRNKGVFSAQGAIGLPKFVFQWFVVAIVQNAKIHVVPI